MNKFLTISIAFIMTVFLTSLASAEYTLNTGTFTNAGGQGSAASYQLFSSIAQPQPLEVPAGNAQSASYRLPAGFLPAASTSGGEPTMVELSLFTATVSAGNITIRWRTEAELDNAGFAIYCSDKKDGNYAKMGFVPAAENPEEGNDYQFTDKEVEPGKTYFYYLEDIDLAGGKSKSEIIKVVVPPAKSARVIPKEFRLLQNYPNPFNPDTWLPYELPKDASVTISIYNVKGQLLHQLDVGRQEAGSYLDKEKAAHWDGRDKTGEAVASGIYFYMLKAGDFFATRRMVIVK